MGDKTQKPGGLYPLCQCGEEAVCFQTKKQNENHGRWFFRCKRDSCKFWTWADKLPGYPNYQQRPSLGTPGGAATLGSPAGRGQATAGPSQVPASPAAGRGPGHHTTPGTGQPAINLTSPIPQYHEPLYNSPQPNRQGQQQQAPFQQYAFNSPAGPNRQAGPGHGQGPYGMQGQLQGSPLPGHLGASQQHAVQQQRQGPGGPGQGQQDTWHSPGPAQQQAGQGQQRSILPQGFDLQAYPRAPAGFTVALSLAEQGWFAAQTAFSQHFIDFVKSFLFSVSGRKWDKDSKSWCFKMEVYEQVIEALQAVGYTVQPLAGKMLKLAAAGEEGCSQEGGGEVPLLPDSEVQALVERYIPQDKWDQLYPFQQEGVRFGLRREGRVLIADEMGLGKTVQAICMATCYPDDWPLLVVCPSSMRYVWQEALRDWLPPELQPLSPDMWVPASQKELDEMEGRGQVGWPHVCIASYDLVQKMKGSRRYGVIIADESHMLKSRTAQRTQFMTRLVKGAKRAVLLTGTPLLSRPIEAWPQVDMLRPGLLGSYHEYGQMYCTAPGAPPAAAGSFPAAQYRGSARLKELNAILGREVMLRRLKDSVVRELPPKVRTTVEVGLDEACLEQLRELQEELKAVSAQIKAAPPGREQEELGFAHKQLVSAYYRATGPAKVPGVLAHLRQLLASKLKVIVFAHHAGVLDAIQEELLKPEGVGYMRIDGKIMPARRKRLVDQFQASEEVQVALLSINAAGVGLTLTASHTVVFAEMAWNPTLMIQAEDRAHRLGQKSQVDIHYCRARGTCDDLIWESAMRKLGVVGTALEGGTEGTARGLDMTPGKGRRPGAAAAAAAPGPSAQQQGAAAAIVDLSQLDRLAELMAAEEHPGPEEDEEQQEEEEGGRGTQAAAAGAAAGGGSRSVRRRLLQDEDEQQQTQQQKQQTQRQTQQQTQQTQRTARSASTPHQQLQSQQRGGQGTQPLSQRAPVVDLSQSPESAAGSTGSAARGAGSSRGAPAASRLGSAQRPISLEDDEDEGDEGAAARRRQKRHRVVVLDD